MTSKNVPQKKTTKNIHQQLTTKNYLSKTQKLSKKIMIIIEKDKNLPQNVYDKIVTSQKNYQKNTHQKLTNSINK